LLDRRIKGLNSVETLQKRGLIGEIRTYNLNNQEQEFFVEFVDYRKSTGYLFFIPKGASFDIRLFLKYSDQTNEEFFNTNGVRIEQGKPLTIEARVREGDQPFLINLFANGIQHLGNTYTASTVACER
jgi:hypothetical protein